MSRNGSTWSPWARRLAALLPLLVAVTLWHPGAAQGADACASTSQPHSTGIAGFDVAAANHDGLPTGHDDNGQPASIDQTPTPVTPGPWTLTCAIALVLALLSTLAPRVRTSHTYPRVAHVLPPVPLRGTALVPSLPALGVLRI
jgi:hypothetical protein